MSADHPFVLALATVETAERVSPSFVRVTFTGDDLARIGTPGHVLDQRIKVIFPPPQGNLPQLGEADDDWYQRWLALPEATRGSMRTYSIRHLVTSTTETRLVVDFVLHLAAGASGPASRWASEARPGSRVLILGPRRGRTDAGGIEFSPGSATSILLAGDETAAPAIARVLEDLDRDAHGVAFIEVPHDDDVLAIDAPNGVRLHWLPRKGSPHGTALLPAVLDYLGATAAVNISDVATEELLWETPTYSGLGETIVGHDNPAERYFWIAGESGVVTTLRRHLVNDLGVDRAQVAFMGYWRRGVAMRA
jgi:NADPH-dependent ferric siderophore reductase